VSQPPEALLELEDVETHYGASQVLFGVSLRLQTGEITTLMGRNGMGKTTTVRAITALTSATGGSIRFRGQRIEAARADAIARAGIALVPEGRQIFPNLSVRENLIGFGANRRAASQPWTLARVLALFPRLTQRLHNLGGQLSGGEQQMLAIGRALMTNAELIIIDEATEGLAPLVREEIWRCLSELRGSGLAVLVIDKHVRRLIELAQRHYIIESGKIVWSGSSAELAAAPQLWQRYLGLA
jgi:branched-chain amino acid transport system ATP-binding protein